MNRTLKYFLLLLLSLPAGLHAQAAGQPGSNTTAADRSGSSSDATAAQNPVAYVREHRSLEYGPFAGWGKGIGERASFNFLFAGVQVGKPLTPVIGRGFLAGQFELGANLMPLWQAYTPPPHLATFKAKDGTHYVALMGGGNYYGASMTPVILRWNFLTHSSRFQPWFQGAGGLIYTTHKFPPAQLVKHGQPGGTSVFNFSPQGGIGVHYFTRANRSWDLGVNAVHISSASLGDRNPGVNASVQVQLGYTVWK